MFQRVFLLGSAALLFGFATPVTQAQTITDIVAESGGEFDDNYFDYDLLLTALQATGLDRALADDSAEYTVWAPNDMAFVRTARDLGFEGTDEAEAWRFLVGALTRIGGGDPIPVLTDILLYHVAGERVGVIDFLLRSIFRVPVDTLLGATFQPFFLLFIEDKEPDLRDARLTFPIGVQASNGIIHSLNRVLLPVDLP